MYIPGLQSITLNKIKQNSHQTHSNQSNSLAIEQFIIHSFFESLLMPERNENKPNYIEKNQPRKLSQLWESNRPGKSDEGWIQRK